MPKSAEAFRTISEVAEWLETPAHVLRFWESKFSQVKPVKRAGGRRYYRPADMQLLGGIKKLLHEDGMTIKGVQKMLREQGIRKVAALSQPLDEVTEVFANEIAEDAIEAETARSATVLPFQGADTSADADAAVETASEDGPAQADQPIRPGHQAEVKPELDPEPEPEESSAAEPVFFRHARQPASTSEKEPEPHADTESPASQEAAAPAAPPPPPADAPSDEAPSALRADSAGEPEPQQTSRAEPKEAEDDERRPALKPLPITVPEDPADDISAEPGILSELAARTHVSPAMARQLEDLAARLKALRG